MGSVTHLAASALPDVSGYVDAVTANRVLGWAWGPRRPGERLAIELRLGDAVIARTVADLPRADLAGSGVGDGHHAFELAIPDAHQADVAQLKVMARVGDGEAVAIGAHPAAEALTDQVARMLRGLDALVGSQRALHRTLQTALASKPDAGSLAAIAETQAALAAQFTTLERFVVRLDARLAALGPASAPAGRAVHPAAMVAFALAAVTLVVGVAGLVHVFAG